MKILARVIGLILLCLVGVACRSGAVAPATASLNESSLDAIQKSGVLRVGYFLFEPTVIRDGTKEKPLGLFVDMIEQIASELRWRVEYRQVDLKNFASALQARDFDLSIGATFASPSRALGVSFTDPIFYMGYTGVATREQATRFKRWEDIDVKGVRVAVKQGSAIGDYVRRHFRNATIIALEQPALSAPLAAVPGQADVGLMNQVTVFTFLRDNPNAGLVEILADKPVEFTGISWAVRSGDAKWLSFVNTALQYLQDTGRVNEWERKYEIPYLFHEERRFVFNSGSRQGRVDVMTLQPTAPTPSPKSVR